MSNVEHINDAGLADFTAGWRTAFGIAFEDDHWAHWVTVTYAVIGLTNFGEKPVPSTRLAEVLGRSVSEAEALARQWGWLLIPTVVSSPSRRCGISFAPGVTECRLF